MAKILKKIVTWWEGAKASCNCGCEFELDAKDRPQTHDELHYYFACPECGALHDVLKPAKEENAGHQP